MSNQPPRRHHFIPEFLINNFRKHDSALYYLSRLSSYPNLKKTAAKRVMFEWDANTVFTLYDLSSAHVEVELGKFDSISALAITRLVESSRSSDVLSVSDADRETIVKMLLTLYRRSPSIRNKPMDIEWAKDIVETSVQDFEQLGGSLNPFQKIKFADENYIELLAKNASISGILEESPLSFSALMSKRIVVARPQKCGKSFILGNNPLFRWHGVGRDRLDHINAEWWLPVAHDTLVGFIGRADVPNIILLDDKKMRSVNLAFWKQSTDSISCSGELLKSIAAHR